MALENTTVLANLQDQFEKVNKELGIDNLMIRAAADRVTEALGSSDNLIDKHDTLLLVVGRGASDPDANSNVTKVTRLLFSEYSIPFLITSKNLSTFFIS